MSRPICILNFRRL